MEIELQKTNLKTTMLAAATRMTECAKQMMVYANALETECKNDPLMTASRIKLKATDLTQQAKNLLDWHDALFPKPVTEE